MKRRIPDEDDKISGDLRQRPALEGPKEGAYSAEPAGRPQATDGYLREARYAGMPQNPDDPELYERLSEDVKREYGKLDSAAP